MAIINGTSRGETLNWPSSTAAGDDVVHGYGGHDIIYGWDGSDSLYGDAGNDRLYGGNGNDLLSGGEGNDTLYASGGDNILEGGAGDDFLSSPGGNNSLWGGTGKDTFGLNLFDWNVPSVQTIHDYSRLQRDIIDLSYLDADANAANDFRNGKDQDFRWVSAPSSEIGTAWKVEEADRVTLYMNIDNDVDPELTVVVLGVSSLTHGVDFFG